MKYPHCISQTKIYLTFNITEKDCGIVQVSAGSDTRFPILYGLYSLSEGKSGPNNPVWKLKDINVYIFNDGSSDGLRIGAQKSLKTGSSYYESKKLYNHWKK